MEIRGEPPVRLAPGYGVPYSSMAMSRREAMCRHAMSRLRDRKGVRLSRGAFGELCRIVAGRRGVELKSGRQAIPVTIRGRKAIAIWCDYHQCIVTFYGSARWLFGATQEPIGREVLT